MKKVTAMFLSVLLLLSFTSCGNQQGTGQQENTQPEAQSEGGDKASDTDIQDSPGQAQETNVEDGFIRITGGTFQMGSPEDEAWRSLFHGGSCHSIVRRMGVHQEGFSHLPVPEK